MPATRVLPCVDWEGGRNQVTNLVPGRFPAMSASAAEAPAWSPTSQNKHRWVARRVCCAMVPCLLGAEGTRNHDLPHRGQTTASIMAGCSPRVGAVKNIFSPPSAFHPPLWVHLTTLLCGCVCVCMYATLLPFCVALREVDTLAYESVYFSNIELYMDRFVNPVRLLAGVCAQRTAARPIAARPKRWWRRWRQWWGWHGAAGRWWGGDGGGGAL